MDCIRSIEYHVLPQVAVAEVPFLSGCRKLLEYMAPTVCDVFDLATPKLSKSYSISQQNIRFEISLLHVDTS